MSRRVTIVMYHYVRDLRRTRYPRIKGLDTREFVGQLAYIREHYDVISIEDVLRALGDPQHALPRRPLLLTFDDGYSDHYHTVFPLLRRYGFPGAFFPPARSILERRVLDVNKIHFLLAAVPDDSVLVEALEARVERGRRDHGLDSVQSYRRSYARANRWDAPEVIYVKRMLQRGLPEELRRAILDELFREFVSADESAFADELYMSVGQLTTMRRHGMYIGAHGHEHVWLNSLDSAGQGREVAASLELLGQIGCDLDRWAMCYPYGGYDESLVRVLRDHGCRLGLTTRVAIADLERDDPLTLPRIDTNDLPRHPNAAPPP